MAITYPINLPTSGITSVTFDFKNANIISRSPFSYQGQVQNWGGTLITASVTVDGVGRDHAEQWIAALTSLRGSMGTFLLGDPMGQNPRGNLPAGVNSVSVDVRAETGATELAVIRAASPNTKILSAGDWVATQTTSSGNRRMYKVLKDVTLDADGKGVVDIWPPLKWTATVGNSVFVRDVKTLFRLSSGTFNYSIDSTNRYSIQFNCEEAI